MSWTVPTIILILQYLQTTAIKKEMKEKLQEIIDKLSALVPEIPGIPGVPQIIVAMPQRSNRYHIFDIDTNVVRANVPLGLKEYLDKYDVEHAIYMTVLAIGGGFTYRMNSGVESLCTAVVGDEWEAFEFTEIFITNPAVAGTAQIHVEYRVEPG
ncbi:hypothetical protein ES702_01800 [subsurface metagenome]